MRGRVIAFFLLAAVLVTVVSAADITLSTDQMDYYFVLGQTAEIPVAISNSYGHAVTGMLQSTTTESSTQYGVQMSSTNSRSQDYTAVEGDSVLTVSAGTADSEKTLKIQLSFAYTDSTPLTATLGEITVHFVKDSSQVQKTKEQVTSTTSAGQSGSSSSSSSSMSTSFQYVQQIQQQSSSSSSGQDLQNNQMAQDTSALKQQLEQEQARSEQRQAEFLRLLNADPTYGGVNATLTNSSYPLGKLEPNPVSNDTGTFTAEFSGSGGSVAVSGSMTNGVVQEIVENTSAQIDLPEALTKNQTYESVVEVLKSENFRYAQTRIITTPSGSTLNLTYQNPDGRAAWINATIQGDNLTSLSFEKEKIDFPFVPIILGGILIAILAAVGYLVYRKYRNRPRKTKPGNPELHTPLQPRDFRKDALALLDNAERAFSAGLDREAYGDMGYALRLFISHRFGSGKELTNREVEDLMISTRNDIPGASGILDRCSLVEFAKDESDPEEFRRYMAFLRRIIKET